MIFVKLVRGDENAQAAKKAMANLMPPRIGKFMFNAPTTRLCKTLARIQGFDLKVVKGKDGLALVPCLMFKDEKQLMLFKLRWA